MNENSSMLFIPEEQVNISEKVLWVEYILVNIYRGCVFCYGVYHMSSALNSDILAVVLERFALSIFQIRASLSYIPDHTPYYKNSAHRVRSRLKSMREGFRTRYNEP